MVLGSAVAAFMEVSPDHIDLIHPHYRKLCRVLADVDEWGQIFIINLLIRYARSQFTCPDPELLVSWPPPIFSPLSFFEYEFDFHFRRPTERLHTRKRHSTNPIMMTKGPQKEEGTWLLCPNWTQTTDCFLNLHSRSFRAETMGYVRTNSPVFSGQINTVLGGNGSSILVLLLGTYDGGIKSRKISG